MIDVVAFDLGGVLVDVDHHRAWRKLDRRAEDAFFGGAHHRAVSVGEMAAAAFLEGTSERAGMPRDRVRAAWRCIVRAFPGASRLVDRVATRAVAWSNTDPEHIDALTTLPVRLFEDGCALSYEIGALKPSPEFYEIALQRLGVAADRVAFVDDRADNVAAALELGIVARQVDGIASTTTALDALGVLRAQ